MILGKRAGHHQSCAALFAKMDEVGRKIDIDPQHQVRVTIGRANPVGREMKRDVEGLR